MGYPFTNSVLANNMSTGMSTQALITVGPTQRPIGAIQNLTVNQSRSIQGITEIGTDGFIEKVPNQATEISLEISRVVFDQLRMPLAFGRAFYNIHAQRAPFDITIIDKSISPASNAEGDRSDGVGIISHIYRNCWFSRLSTPYQSDNYIITESATVSVEYVQTLDSSGNSAVPVGPGIEDFTEPFGGTFNFERAADTGRRGSLDSSGLALLLAPQQ